MWRLPIILLALAAFYVGYSAWCVRGLAVGLEQKDANKISDYVDFPSVRTSLKEQITSALMAETMADFEKKNDAGAKIGAGLIATLGPTIINNMIEGFVTPSGIAALLSRKKNVTNQDGDVIGTNNGSTFQINKFLEHVSILSPTRFRLANREGMSLVFVLEDWSWKLVEIRAPHDFLKKPATRTR